MQKIAIDIGDWSDDGHGQNEKFVFNINKTIEEVVQWYKDSCKLTWIQFNHNENYTWIEWYDVFDTETNICTDYQDSSISEKAMAILKSYWIQASEEEPDTWYVSIEEFPILILNFIKLSIKDLEWEEASYKRSEWVFSINADGLSEHFGYGLFD